MSIELVKLNQYGERFSSSNIDDEIQKTSNNPGLVETSDGQEVEHRSPSISEVLFERQYELLDPLPLISIKKALTATSTSTVEEVVSILRPNSDGLPVSEVIYHDIYHEDQINEANLGVTTPTGGRIVYQYSPNAT